MGYTYAYTDTVSVRKINRNIMKKYTKWIVSALMALTLIATTTYAADTVAASSKATVTQTAPAENWVLTLGGVGNSVTSGDTSTAFGVDISVGYLSKWLLPTETGLRQTISYGNDDVTLNTRLYNDWTLYTFEKQHIDLFGGGAIGLQYGNMKPSWEIAPEAGIRWWMKKDVAVIGRVEVPWDMGQWEFKDSIRYFLGFQVKF